MKPVVKKISKAKPDNHLPKAGKAIKKLTTKKEWSNLLIDPVLKQQLESIGNSMMNNRIIENIKAINPRQLNKILFTGSNETAKQLAITLLGKTYNQDVYRVNLSRLISNHTSETENNIAKLFTAAENKNRILFFDEADALFGKRADVKDSHDTYANQEVSYLLQQMESYEGIIVISSSTVDSYNLKLKHFNTVMHFKKR